MQPADKTGAYLEVTQPKTKIAGSSRAKVSDYSGVSVASENIPHTGKDEFRKFIQMGVESDVVIAFRLTFWPDFFSS